MVALGYWSKLAYFLSRTHDSQKEDKSMKFSNKQYINILVFWMLLLMLAFITVKTQLDSRVLLEQEPILPEIGIHAFFDVFNGNRYIVFLFLGIIITLPNILVIHFYHHEHNNFNNFILTRISYHNYTRRMVLYTAILTFTFYLTLHIAILPESVLAS